MNLRTTKNIEAAKRYAAADSSDPFALGRAMLHLSNGVCGVRPDKDTKFALYDATYEGSGQYGNRSRP